MYEEVFETFDSMGLQENLLMAIFDCEYVTTICQNKEYGCSGTLSFHPVHALFQAVTMLAHLNNCY
ncbi:hypothetical protein NC653_028016 [Populus alba x Populus x berolinensis]|uniref:Uncharacterized protein n=1 Tax=Populus alba x Populus x berolinensis TaxID=444605 RepID=A0AAD6M6W7_9ROSI|nr:hypothetical protein NC653_028016 [Populus alba x Populus x berolinensis]